MVQLNGFAFPKAGQIIFEDAEGSPCDIGPQSMADIQAMLDRLDDDDYNGSYFL